MQCIILHGAFGNIHENWFIWLKRELEKLGHEVFLDQYPVDKWSDIEQKGKDNINTIQNLTSWTNFFEKEVLPHLDLNKELAFFGHSLSPVFILHLVAKYNLKVKTLIVASPFLEPLNAEVTWQFDVVNRTFYKTNFNWDQLKKHIAHSYVLYGTADPYVPAHFPIDFAKHLGSTLIPIEGGKHLGGELKEFPLLLDLFNKI
jgi:predicted alpha/beta hydrolase family esterase